MKQTSVLFTKRCLGDAGVCKQLNDYLAEHPGYEVALTNFFSDPYGCSETLFVVFNLPAESLKPVVDAAPVVHSKWVWIPDEEEDNILHLVCDACKHGGLFEDDNYCPNCGAFMK